MATGADWAVGYARQADADLRLFDRLRADPSVPDCQKLMLLQMACEKLVKGDLCALGSDPATLQTSHAYISGTLPLVVHRTAVRLNYDRRRVANIGRFAVRLCGEIELLTPSVTRAGQRPDNCEYPWENGNGDLHVPLDWSFAGTRLLAQPAGRVFLTLVRAAVDELVP